MDRLSEGFVVMFIKQCQRALPNGTDMFDALLLAHWPPVISRSLDDPIYCATDIVSSVILQLVSC